MNSLELSEGQSIRYPWKILDLGRISFERGLKLQNKLWKEVKSGGDHHLLLLEHDPVITLGRRTDPKHLLKTKEELKKDGIDLFKINRGGSATFHGPGQLVGYIICKSSRMGGIHKLVSKILQALFQATSQFGIRVTIDKDNPGIWTSTNPPKKIAAVGMQNKMGFTLHGFAINVDMLLTGFSMIVPCGLQLPVSTISIEKGERVSVKDFKQTLIKFLLKELK